MNLQAAGIRATAAIGPDPRQGAPGDVLPWVNLAVDAADNDDPTAPPLPVAGYLSADDAVAIGTAILTAALEARTDALVYTTVAELADETLAKALIAAVRDARHAIPDHPPTPPQ